MLNNLTDSELLKLIPTTELEAELITRLTGSTEQDWEYINSQLEHWFTQAREKDEFAEKIRDALRKVMTEIHRCADFGTVEITPEFRKRCEEVVCAVDEYVVYEYPQLPGSTKPINNSSSFRAGGQA